MVKPTLALVLAQYTRKGARGDHMGIPGVGSRIKNNKGGGEKKHPTEEIIVFVRFDGCNYVIGIGILGFRF